ncbi:MAG: UvrD-helicase domain-containing protein [Planctomycetota bacterium]|jgi:DNA helicase-2/ATP-dependent DNA helicase PcrA|nr:UvrD-helicase domain-containing protein [Planctomycetota bacterium]
MTEKEDGSSGSIPAPGHPLLDRLNGPQKAAASHVEGALLVLAGPGSGKTRVMTHRIAHMIAQGVPAWEIVALTFTNKAADEMKRRLAMLVPGQKVWAGTFHKFCATLLRRYASLVGLKENFSIYDRDDQRKALKQAIEEAEVELFQYTPDEIANKISWAKNQLISPEEYTARPGDPLGSLVERTYEAYQRRLLEANAADFDDLLYHVARLIRDHEDLRRALDQRFKYILVDEYQDTNLVQYMIVRGLSIDHPNLAVTGDPDQSIYGWRGASLNNIMEFEQDYPDVEVVRLEQNYRSTHAILSVADQLIRNNAYRKHKELFTENQGGTAVKLVHYSDHRDEADRIADQILDAVQEGRRQARDFAIFYRVNALSRTLEQALRRRGLPYQIVNGLEFYQRREVKDILAYLLLLNNPQDDIAFERIINVPARKIGKTTVGHLRRHARQYRMPMIDAAREALTIEGLSPRSAKMVAQFVSLYDELSPLVTQPVEELMGQVMVKTAYRDLLANSDKEEDQQRLANIDELLSAAREYDDEVGEEGGLEGFLEQASLVADTDALHTENDKITLMTLHAAKGLEFPCVYIVACEDNLIPHSRSKNDPDQIEEERRLLFVGITRAEEELQLSLAHYRTLRGSDFPTSASPFLLELPREQMDVRDMGLGSRFDLPDFMPETDVEMTFETPWEGDADFSADSSPEEEVYDDQGAKSGKGGSKKKKSGSGGHKLLTAAQMAGESVSRRVDPELFQFGMLVSHPEYGSGKIVALSGRGLKRTASVDFFDGSQKKFRLAFATLQPISAAD